MGVKKINIGKINIYVHRFLYYHSSFCSTAPDSSPYFLPFRELEEHCSSGAAARYFFSQLDGMQWKYKRVDNVALQQVA